MLSASRKHVIVNTNALSWVCPGLLKPWNQGRTVCHIACVHHEFWRSRGWWNWRLFIYFLNNRCTVFFMKWSWQFIVIHGKSEFRSNATSMVPFTKHRMVLRIPMKSYVMSSLRVNGFYRLLFVVHLFRWTRYTELKIQFAGAKGSMFLLPSHQVYHGFTPGVHEISRCYIMLHHVTSFYIMLLDCWGVYRYCRCVEVFLMFLA